MSVSDQKDRCSGIYKAGIDGDYAPRAVFSSLVRRPRLIGIMGGIFQKDSYALGSGTYKAGIAGDCAPGAVFASLVRRPMMLGILAGMDLKSVFMFVDIPFVLQRQILMVQTFLQTIDFPQLLFKVVDVPVSRSSRFISPSWRSAVPIVQTVRRTIFFPSEHGGRCPCCAGRAGSLSRRGAEAGPWSKLFV